MSNNAKNKQQNKTFRTVGIVILILLAIAIIVFLFRSCGADKPEDDPAVNKGLVYDSSAIEGGWDEADADAIIAGLNEKVEAGMINISMNTAPIFSDGSSAGNLMIVNESWGNYPQIVVITRNDTGDEIYRSGGIPVGSKIETAKLAAPLPAGTYECTALFHNVNPDTGESLGGDPAATAMSVTVPTALPMAMAQDGSVTTADNCKIVNNSYGAVRVKSVTISGANGWTLTAFGDKSTLASAKVDSDKLGFALTLGGGAQVKTDNSNTASQALISAPVFGCYMTGVGDQTGNSISVIYDAIVTPLSNAVTNATIANVVFIVEWDA